MLVYVDIDDLYLCASSAKLSSALRKWTWATKTNWTWYACCSYEDLLLFRALYTAKHLRSSL